MKKKKKMTKSIRTKMELVVGRFDFSKVRSAMLALNWTWGGDIGGYYPDVEDMRSTAFELLENSYEGGYSIAGGFEARYSGREFYLNFVVEGADSYVEEDEAEEKPEKSLSIKPKTL